MGSFIGHVDEATFFILLALWWMFNTFSRYVQSVQKDTQYTSRLSFGLPCKKKIPVEAIFKLLFPIGGIIGELANGKGPHFIDSNGNFEKLNGMQHLTIYGMFCLHGILDILTYCKVKAIPPGSDYFSVFLSFIWYGMSFTFHANMPGKSPVERIVHLLPTYVMYFMALLIIIHFSRRHNFVLDLGRIWCLLVLGTWFIHTSFIMYIPWGDHPNPDWDRTDHRNVHFLVAAFGAHCCLHIITIPVVYGIMHFFMFKRHQQKLCVNGSYKKSHDECEILLETL